MSNRYTGQILDEDTGLYYYGARYGACPERSRRDPELGRFIQADPIVPGADNSQALNRYSYCFNNPLQFIDPTGHWPDVHGNQAILQSNFPSGWAPPSYQVIGTLSFAGGIGNVFTVSPGFIGAGALSDSISGSAGNIGQAQINVIEAIYAKTIYGNSSWWTEMISSKGEKVLNAFGLSNPRIEKICGDGKDPVCYNVLIIDSKYFSLPIAIPTEEQFNAMLNFKMWGYPSGVVSEINSRMRLLTPENKKLMKCADSFWFQLQPRKYLWMDPVSKNGPWNAEAMNYIQIGHGLRHFRFPEFSINGIVRAHNMKNNGNEGTWQEKYKCKEGWNQYNSRKDW